MALVRDTYFARVRSLIDKLEQDQGAAIDDLSRRMCDRILAGRCVHLIDHGHLLGSEMRNRAGGLPLLDVIDMEAATDPMRVRPGDMVLFASVSGRAADVVDTALALRRRGVHVVAMTSLSQATVAPPGHDSGQLLKDVADEVIDLGVPATDAMVTVAGLEQPICASSGIAAVVLAWALMSQTAEHLVRAGRVPTVFTSVNVPGGPEAYAAQLERFASLGY